MSRSLSLLERNVWLMYIRMLERSISSIDTLVINTLLGISLKRY